METFDVGIVGSGPAAFSSAIYLSKLGLKVVMFCEENNFDIKKHYGETIPINIKETLYSIGLENLLETIRAKQIRQTVSAWSAFQYESSNSILKINHSGWLLERELFEQQFRSTAIENGVIVINDRLINYRRSNGLWCIFIHSKAGKNIEINVGTFVFATGRKTRGPIQLGKRTTLDKLIVCNIVFKIKPDEYDSNIRVNSTKGGWLFSVCTNNQNRIVNFFTDSDLLTAKSCDELIPHLNLALKSSSALNEVVKEIKLDDVVSFSIAPANTTFRKDIFYNGALVCGDTAQTFDPLSSHGICYAINDAISLSRAVFEMMDGSKGAMMEHEARRRRAFSDYLLYRHRIYCLNQQWTKCIFWERRQKIETLKEYARKLV